MSVYSNPHKIMIMLLNVNVVERSNNTFHVQEALKLAMPIAISNLVSYFLGHSTISRTTAWGNAIMLIVLGFCVAIPHTQVYIGQMCIEMRMRAACCGLIFQKVMLVM